MTLDAYIDSLQRPVWMPLAALAVLFFAATGLGAAVWRTAHPDRRPVTAPELFPATVLGFDLLALAALLLSRTVIAAPVGGLWAALTLPALYGASCWRRFPWNRRLGAVWVFAAAGAVTLGSALLPPYAWDEMVYQTALPVRYLSEGSAAVLADNSYSAFPAFPHFLMLAGIRMGGICFARLLVWGAYLLAFGGFYAALRRRFGRGNAVAVTLALALSPVVQATNRENYQEIFIVLNLFAGAAALFEFRRAPAAGGVLGGLFAGMALAVKLTAGGVAAGMLILACGVLKRRAARLWFCAAASLAALPFYLRSWIATGNPFYPFGARWLAPGSAAARVDLYQTRLGTSLYGDGPLGILTGWVTAGYAEHLYDGITLGLQYFVLIALAVFAWNAGRSRPLRGIVAAGLLCCYLFWALSSQQVRFLLPWYFAAAFAAAAGLRRLAPHRRRIAWGALAAAAMLSVHWPELAHYPKAWRLLGISRRDRGRFLGWASRDPEYFRMLAFIGERTPPDAGILLLFERRGLYVPRRYEIATPDFQEKHLTPPPENAGALLRALRNSGADYLLVGASARNPDPIPEYEEINARTALQLIELLRAGEIALVDVPGGGDYTLLKLR